MLFTDGSVNTQSKIGYGAYLVVEEKGLSIEVLKKLVKVKRFEDTSSTKLELQTLLWALKEIELPGRKVKIYTDSQNIIGLPGRRKRFEQNDYRSKKNIRIKNYKLYQEFYEITDHLDFELVKVEGHQRSNQKDDIARLFTIVDKASRKALKEID
jgi:ribonuclease HI